MKIKSLIKKVFSNEAFLPVDDVVKEIQQLLPLSQTAVSDFIINCDIEKRLYKDKEVFVNFANAEDIVACGSCGKLAMGEEIVDEDGFQFPKKSRRGFKYSHPFSVFYQIEKTIRVLVRRQPSHIHKFKSLLASLGIVTVEMIVSFL